MMQVSIAKFYRNELQIIGFPIPVSNTGYKRFTTYFCQESNKKKNKTPTITLLREKEKKTEVCITILENPII